jgi:hypothetical protein
VLYHDSDEAEGQHTVVTAARGPLKGSRVVAGRDVECLEHYRTLEAGATFSPQGKPSAA